MMITFVSERFEDMPSCLLKLETMFLLRKPNRFLMRHIRHGIVLFAGGTILASSLKEADHEKGAFDSGPDHGSDVHLGRHSARQNKMLSRLRRL